MPLVFLNSVIATCAIAAYFFLVGGVGLRLFGMTKSSERIFEHVDARLLMFLVKSAAVLALLSAGVAVGYEFLGKRGLLIAGLPAIAALAVLYRYVMTRLDESEHARDW